MKLPYRILVIDDDENALAGIVELLRGADYEVTASASYEDAKALLSIASYDLLITDVRLGSFNGINLVKRIRAEAPDTATTAIVIMTGYDDALMEVEARRYNAQFVRKPIKPAEFLDVVARSLASVRRQRRWPRKRVVGGFRVTADGRPAAVLEVGYGGLRLEMPATNVLPHAFAVEVPAIGLSLEVTPVWSYTAADSGAVVCGAALLSESTSAARTWRAIVDRLSA
jgi:DNA-binding response OmpR family regulator